MIGRRKKLKGLRKKRKNAKMSPKEKRISILNLVLATQKAVLLQVKRRKVLHCSLRED